MPNIRGMFLPKLQKQLPEVFCKKKVFLKRKVFEIFKEKHLYWNLFLIKLQAILKNIYERLQILWKSGAL